jgi:hypothetical protein
VSKTQFVVMRTGTSPSDAGTDTGAFLAGAAVFFFTGCG